MLSMQISSKYSDVPILTLISLAMSISIHESSNCFEQMSQQRKVFHLSFIEFRFDVSYIERNYQNKRISHFLHFFIDFLLAFGRIWNCFNVYAGLQVARKPRNLSLESLKNVSIYIISIHVDICLFVLLGVNPRNVKKSS